MLDRQKAIALYVNRVQDLDRLPFITDREMKELFGGEITAKLDALSLYSKETRLCAGCRKRCCLVAKCELYDEKFPLCPVYDLRPVVCRMHYCHLFQKDCGLMVEELSDVFFECVTAAEAVGIPHARLFDSPPIARCAPEFVARIEPVMQQMREGKITPQQAAAVIYAEAGCHRVRI